jgi:tetratricopeptide (TPR) repeat protein
MNKNYDEAIEMYTKAIEEDPADPVYYTNSKEIKF